MVTIALIQTTSGAPRLRCLDLFKRLHAAGFTQGSVFSRNILVQPGPLCAPPEDRSGDTLEG